MIFGPEVKNCDHVSAQKRSLIMLCWMCNSFYTFLVARLSSTGFSSDNQQMVSCSWCSPCCTCQQEKVEKICKLCLSFSQMQAHCESFINFSHGQAHANPGRLLWSSWDFPGNSTCDFRWENNFAALTVKWKLYFGHMQHDQTDDAKTKATIMGLKLTEARVERVVDDNFRLIFLL